MAIPNQIYRGTVAQVSARAKARAEAMTERHPGTKFSTCVDNPLGVKMGKHLGVPGAGLPKAIINQGAEPISDPKKVKLVLDAFEVLHKLTRYEYQAATYIVYADPVNLDFPTLFGVLAYLRREFPYQVTYSGNRLGHAVYIKIDYRTIRESLHLL